MAEAPVREGEEEQPRHALDLTASASTPIFSFTFSIKIVDRQLAGRALLGIGCGVALAAFLYRYPDLVASAARNALEGPGLQVTNITPGSIFVKLRCNKRESFLLFLKEFDHKKVKERLENEFRKVGFKEELEVTITNDKEVYEKLDQILSVPTSSSQSTREKEESSTPEAFQEGSKTSYPRGTVLLSTRMRYGVVSYENTDVATWKDGGKWRLSDVFAGLLREEWKSTPVARLELVTDDNRVATVKVTDETSTSDETSERRNNCSIS